jgi:hypothetical protein
MKLLSDSNYYLYYRSQVQSIDKSVILKQFKIYKPIFHYLHSRAADWLDTPELELQYWVKHFEIKKLFQQNVTNKFRKCCHFKCLDCFF